jgi:hypothetical protein
MAADKDSRTFIRVHDGMPDHPKIEGLSDGAFRLIMTMWCWCSRYLTDGHVPATTWNKRGTPKARRELIAAGLVEETDDGVQMHDYLDWQRSAEEVDQLRQKRRDAGRRGGQAKANRLASAKQVPEQELQQTASKSVPESESESEKYLSQSLVSPDVPRATTTDDDDRPNIDYPDLAARLRPLLGPVTEPWARQVAAQILTRANGDVTNPTNYILTAVARDPAPYRPTSQPPPPSAVPRPEPAAVVASEDAASYRKARAALRPEEARPA